VECEGVLKDGARDSHVSRAILCVWSVTPPPVWRGVVAGVARALRLFRTTRNTNLG